MKAGWKTVTLGDVSIVGAGNSAPQDKRLFEGGTFPFIRTSDVGKIRVGELYAAQDHLNGAGIRKLKLHRAGTVLIPKSGASTFLDHRVIMGIDAYVSSHLATLWPKEEIIDGRYLFWVSQQIVASEVASDTSYPTLSLEQIKGIEVLLPPLEEQRRIVAVLDEAFAAIATATANAEKNLANARELFACELGKIFTVEAVDWGHKRLSEVAREFGRGKSRHRPRGDPRLYGSTAPLIQTGDVSNADHWLNGYTQMYSELGVSQSKLWPKGTVCVAIVGANVGESAILNFDACFPDSVIGIVPDDKKSHPEYIEYLLQFYKNDLKEKGKGTARDNINIETFENQLMPFPDLLTQKQVVARLNAATAAIGELVSLIEAKQAALAELKQSLLHRAFIGELTATLPVTVAA